MTLKSIREMRDATPFKPFEIHLSSGRVLPVATCDHLFFLPLDPEFIVALPDGGFQIVDPGHVEAIKPQRRAKAA